MESNMENTLQSYLDIQDEMNLNKKEEKFKPLQSDKSANLYDFIKMVDMLIKRSMPNVRFFPDEGKVVNVKDAMEKFNSPVITYKIIERVPKQELKPRIRQGINEQAVISASDSKRIGNVWGQKFKCLVQFNIIASVYDEAEQVMNDFEDLIISYAGYIKKNGIAELLFNKHCTDEHYDKLRETLSVRNLIYYVEVEKLTVILKETIKDIDILAQQKEEI